MPLVTNVFKDELKVFIEAANKTTQADLDSAIDNFCAKLEQAVYDAIKSATVTIEVLTGEIVVTGTALTQANPAPIVLTGTIT